MTCGRNHSTTAGEHAGQVATEQRAVAAAFHDKREDLSAAYNALIAQAAAAGVPTEVKTRRGRRLIYTCGQCGHEFYPRGVKDGAPTRCPGCSAMVEAPGEADRVAAAVALEAELTPELAEAAREPAPAPAPDQMVRPAPSDPEPVAYSDDLPARFDDDASLCAWLKDGASEDYFGGATDWEPLEQVKHEGQKYLAVFCNEPQDAERVRAQLDYIMRGELAFGKTSEWTDADGVTHLDHHGFEMITPGGRPLEPGERGRLYFFKCDWDASGRTSFLAAAAQIPGLREYLNEGTPVRKTDRSGPGTKGTRAFDGLSGGVRFAFADGAALESAAVESFVEQTAPALAIEGLYRRDALIAALSELHHFIPRCEGCGRFLATQHPVCQNPRCKLRGEAQGEAVAWPPPGYHFKNSSVTGSGTGRPRRYNRPRIEPMAEATLEAAPEIVAKLEDAPAVVAEMSEKPAAEAPAEAAPAKPAGKRRKKEPLPPIPATVADVYAGYAAQADAPFYVVMQKPGQAPEFQAVEGKPVKVEGAPEGMELFVHRMAGTDSKKADWVISDALTGARLAVAPTRKDVVREAEFTFLRAARHQVSFPKTWVQQIHTAGLSPRYAPRTAPAPELAAPLAPATEAELDTLPVSAAPATSPHQDDTLLPIPPRYGMAEAALQPGAVIETPATAEPQVVTTVNAAGVYAKPAAGGRPTRVAASPAEAAKKARQRDDAPPADLYAKQARVFEVEKNDRVPYFVRVKKGDGHTVYAAAEANGGTVRDVRALVLPGLPEVEFFAARVARDMGGLGDEQQWRIYNAMTGAEVSRSPRFEDARTAALARIAGEFGGPAAYRAGIKKALAEGLTSPRYRRLNYTCGQCGHEFYPRAPKEGEPHRCPHCGAGNATRGQVRDQAVSDDAAQRALAAADRNLPPDLYGQLAQDVDQRVRQALSENQGVPAEVRAQARTSEDDAERAALLAELAALEAEEAELAAMLAEEDPA